MKNEFNSDPSVLIFNNNQVTETPNQKHLGLFLDEKLNFGEHLSILLTKSVHPLRYYINFRNVYRNDD